MDGNEIIKQAIVMYNNDINNAAKMARQREATRTAMALGALMGYDSKQLAEKDFNEFSSLEQHVENCLNVPENIREFLRTNMPPRKADRIILAAITAGAISMADYQEEHKTVTYEQFLQKLSKNVETAMYEELRAKRKYAKHS